MSISSTESCKKAIEATANSLALMILSLISIPFEGVAQLIVCPHMPYYCMHDLYQLEKWYANAVVYMALVYSIQL